MSGVRRQRASATSGGGSSVPLALAAACALLLGGVAGCSGDSSGGKGGSASTARSGGDTTTLTVFAASSLTNVFGELEKAFEAAHPGVNVVVSYDSSTTLATQITQGAPADVLATADEVSMSLLVDAGRNTATPVPFASNTMALVTPPDNPAGIASLDDLAGTDFVLCDPSAPCGAVAARILDNAHVTARPVSLEDKVTAVLSKVELGEADAGLVYVSDAQAAGADNVHRIDISPQLNVVTPYYIAGVKGSANSDQATAWMSLVSSEAGQDALQAAGFGPP